MFRWKNKSLDGWDPKKITKNFATYFVLALAVGAMTFFGVCTPSGPGPSLPGGDAARIADARVTSSTFRRAYQNAHSRYQQQYKDQFDVKALQLSKRVMEQIVNDYILFVEAKRSGVFSHESEVDKLILEAEVFRNEGGKFDPQRFEAFLANQGYTESSFQEEIRRNLTNDKMRRFVTDAFFVSENAARWNYKLTETKFDVEYLKFDKSKINVNITTDDIVAYLKDEANKKSVKSYYDSNKSEFNSPRKVRARHILSGFKGARNAAGEAAKRTEEEAKVRAEGILAQLNAGGVNFEDLAKEKTDDPSGKNNGGDLGFFEAKDMVKEFSDVAFSMKKGELSGLVKSNFGYHIIRVEDIQEAKSTKLEDAESQIARKRLSKSKAPEFLKKNAEEILTALKNGDAGVVGKMQTAGVEWQTTGEFAANARYIPGLGSQTEFKKAVLGLSNPGQIHAETIEASGHRYIVRLKGRKDADLSKVDKDKIKELAESRKFFEAYTTFNALSNLIRDEYRKGGKVWENEEFRDLDVGGRPGT